MAYPNKQNRSIVIGSKYGNYTVIRKTKRYKLGHYKTIYICKCTCGTINKVLPSNLTSGHSAHCLSCRIQSRKGPRSPGWKGGHLVSIKRRNCETRYHMYYKTYYKLRNKCKNTCTCCGRHLKRKRDLHLDHNHKTGQIRDFICSKCNWGLGCFNDSPLYLTRAIKYLKEHNGNSSGLRSK